ncbi:MAG: cation-translocating P-type ATPase [Lentisphaerae bacterium]|nr:MAG: cation-translocating P-type ATPase [Lentisphaerota bacterium]
MTALVPLEGVSNVELLRCAASVEQDSTHPIARAVTELAKQANLPLAKTSELRETPGRGVAARLDDDLVLLGNKLWMEENGLDLSKLDLNKASDTATLLFVARNRNILGWIEVEDTLRPDAGEMVRRLRDHGISSLAMVSGDREKVCRKIGQQLELDHIYGECIPQQKVELVRQAKQEGRVLFVGDGVNDGPALAESDIAIAMGGIGSDLALETASIVLLNNRLTRIPFILKVSRLSRWIIIQNLIAGAFVVVFGIILALTIELQPWVAALLQLGGALFPLFNSARLLKYYDTDQQIPIPPVGDEAK